MSNAIQYKSFIARTRSSRTSNLRREQSGQCSRWAGEGMGRWLTGKRCEECFFLF